MTARGIPWGMKLVVVQGNPQRVEDRVQATYLLLAQAQDYEHALAQFQQVLRSDHDNQAALYGAGQAAFHLGRIGPRKAICALPSAAILKILRPRSR